MAHVFATVTSTSPVLADCINTAAVLLLWLQLVGPLLGPLLGGVLSQLFGWRSTFICLTVFCGAIVFPLLMVLVPETHQYRVVRRMNKADPAAVKQIAGG